MRQGASSSSSCCASKLAGLAPPPDWLAHLSMMPPVTTALLGRLGAAVVAIAAPLGLPPRPFLLPTVYTSPRAAIWARVWARARLGMRL